MKNFLTVLTILILSHISDANIIISSHSVKGGTDHRLIQMQEIQPGSGLVALYEFSPNGYSRRGIKGWTHSRTLLAKTTITSIRDYVINNNPSSLGEKESSELLGIVEKKNQNAKDSAAISIMSALTGPVAPIAFLISSWFKTLSAEALEEKVIQYTNPLILLLTTMKSEKIIYADQNYKNLFEQELNSYVANSSSDFESAVLMQKQKDLERARNVERQNANQNF